MDSNKPLVIVLLSLLGSIVAVGGYTWATMPDTYVRLERYKCDYDRLEKQLSNINAKLDHIVSYARNDTP